MDPKSSVVTPTRFAGGLTLDQYLSYIGTPENLRRESGWLLGPRRVNFSAIQRERYERCRLRDAQVDAIRYRKESLLGAMLAPRSSETSDEAFARGIRDWRALQDSPFFWLWGSAAIDEMLSALHERIVVGSP